MLTNSATALVTRKFDVTTVTGYNAVHVTRTCEHSTLEYEHTCTMQEHSDHAVVHVHRHCMAMGVVRKGTL